MAKSIALTHGFDALVDDDDYDYLKKYKWHISAQGYAVRRGPRNGGHGPGIYMHKEVLAVPAGTMVDHANGNRIDNRKSNLRPCNKSQNSANRVALNKNNTSGFHGLTFDKKKRVWKVRIGVNKKRIYLGDFKDPQRAARAYDAAAIKYFGVFASLNFPEKVG